MRPGVAKTRCKLTDLLSPYRNAVLPIQNPVGISINFGLGDRATWPGRDGRRFH